MKVAFTPVLRACTPTATQSFALAHDTLNRLPFPATLALGTTRHEVPRHVSARVVEPCAPRYEPTAAQAFGAVHTTPPSLLTDDEDTLGLGTTVHDVPFHSSTRVRPVCCDGSCSPTAKHAEAVEHDTLLSELPTPDGLGLAMTDHVLPFHRSTSVRWIPDAEVNSPTAAQVEVSTHDTPASIAPCPGVGLAIRDQDPPSQWAMRVRASPPVGAKLSPTAMQDRELTQDTAPSEPITARSGAATTDQPVPSQRSTSGRSLPCAYPSPTAKHDVESGHETDARVASDAAGLGDGTIIHISGAASATVICAPSAAAAMAPAIA
jgi:hypothetical protein